jgi:hypothetical protein
LPEPKLVRSAEAGEGRVLTPCGGWQVLQKLEGHGDTVVGVACHPRLPLLASCSLGADPAVRIWVHDSG